MKTQQPKGKSSHPAWEATEQPAPKGLSCDGPCSLITSAQESMLTGSESEAAPLQAMADQKMEQQPITQLKEMAGGDSTGSIGGSEQNDGLPNNLQLGIEQLSGFEMSDVKVHYNSSKPAQFQALAYAQGTDIHIAPGQQQYLPHEAWHVVQQKQGRVQPTRQLKGRIGINDDQGLEREADVMGAKAAQLKGEAEPIQLKKQGRVEDGGVYQFGIFGRENYTGPDHMFSINSINSHQGGHLPAHAASAYPTPQRQAATIDDFLKNMAHLTSVVESSQSTRKRDMVSSVVGGMKEVFSTIADVVGIEHEKVSQVKDISESVIKVAINIGNYIRENKGDRGSLRGLITLIRNNLRTIKEGASAASELLGMTSFLPYWGIAVKSIMICRDCLGIYNSYRHLNDHDLYTATEGTSLDMYFQDVAKKEFYSHIGSLVKHGTKLTMKVASAAGVPAIGAKPMEVGIVAGQLLYGVGNKVYKVAQQSRHQEDYIMRMKELIIMAKQASKDQYMKGKVEDYLSHLGLNNSSFYELDGNAQALEILNRFKHK